MLEITVWLNVCSVKITVFTKMPQEHKTELLFLSMNTMRMPKALVVKQSWSLDLLKIWKANRSTQTHFKYQSLLKV